MAHVKADAKRGFESKSKMTKDEKEAEFIEAIEQLLGFPLMPWQRPIILKVRADSLAGKPIDFSLIHNRKG